MGDLEAAVKDGLLTAAQGGVPLTRVAGTARLLASIAIDEAVQRGSNGGKIEDARRSVSTADQRVSAGGFKDGVAAYRNALSLAEGA